jgi:LuxR family maltose regulon positive regulatory protein
MVRVPASKVAIPDLPRWFVPRSWLWRRLDEAHGARLVAVIAPAGSGKTVLLAEWARDDAGTRTAWVSLDPDDADPRRLRAAILAAVAAAGPAGSAVTRPPDAEAGHGGDGEDPTDALLDALDAVRPPVRLVLDDVHVLAGSRAGTEVLTRLLRRNPAGVRLVLAARSDPPLALPRLRVEGLLTELRADELRFSPDDAAALLEASGVGLDAEDVAVLHRRTEGWAGGLRLATIALRRSGEPRAVLARFGGDERSVADYLTGEVLAALPAASRSLLQDVSVCGRLPAALAVALTERSDAAHVLDELVHGAAMVERVAPHEYRLHSLLRAYLVADLARHRPTRHRQLHAVASRWWGDRHDTGHALRHAERACDPRLTIELVRRDGVRLLLAGHPAPLRRALALVGPRDRQEDARLALTAALTHLEDRDPAAAAAELVLARGAWPAGGDPSLEALRTAIELLAAALRGAGNGATVHLAAGPVDPVESVEPELAALVYLGRAEAALAPGSAMSIATARDGIRRAVALARAHGFASLEAKASTLLAVAACGDGDSRAMAAAARDAQTAAVRFGHHASAPTALAIALAACAELLRGEPELARSRCDEALEAGETLPADSAYALHVVRGAALGDGGGRRRQTSGLAEARTAREAVGALALPAPLAGALAVLEFRMAIRVGSLRAAGEVVGWLRARTGETTEVVLMRAWAQAATGHHAAARASAATVVDDGARRGGLGVEIHLLEAEAALQDGDDAAGRTALDSAVHLGRARDLVRPFTEAGVRTRAVLLEAGEPSTPFDALIAAACAATSVDADPVSLSERELVVLALLPSLLNAPAMAEELVVSVNTVKTHIRSIYAKLGVSTRRDAVSRAYERELLV